MEILKIPLLPQESEREFKNSDEDLRELGALLQGKRYAILLSQALRERIYGY
jgi:hypothetical protein